MAASQRQYACPMHPEVIAAAPGECPICGMALSETAVDPALPRWNEGAAPPLQGTVDAARRRFFSQEVRGPASVPRAGWVRALLYADEIPHARARRARPVRERVQSRGARPVSASPAGVRCARTAPPPGSTSRSNGASANSRRSRRVGGASGEAARRPGGAGQRGAAIAGWPVRVCLAKRPHLRAAAGHGRQDGLRARDGGVRPLRAGARRDAERVLPRRRRSVCRPAQGRRR